MTDEPIRRRGRPPMSINETQPEAEAPEASAVEPSRRRKRHGLGGFAAKLHAPTREGFVRRFVNDDGNNVAMREELGYTIVEQPGVQTFDAGSAITRLAGTKDGGAPLKAILMETPIELYQQGRDEMEQVNAVTDQAILEGRDRENGLSAAETYRPAGHTNSIEVKH